MSGAIKIQPQTTSFKTVLSAVKKLSAAEKQLLKLQLFATDALAEMKSFELQLKKSRKPVKKTDEEIVSITTSIRRKRNASSQKMLH
jgi:hypothetical protein